MSGIHNPNYIRCVKIHITALLDAIKSELFFSKHYLSDEEIEGIDCFPHNNDSKEITLGQKRYMELLMHQETLRIFLLKVTHND